MFKAADLQTENVVKDTERANAEIGKGIKNARRTRKMKWCLFIFFLLIVLGVALYFIIKYVQDQQAKKKTTDTTNASTSGVGFSGV
jgi:t-SNARE complex subunit (syntaxin)